MASPAPLSAWNAPDDIARVGAERNGRSSQATAWLRSPPTALAAMSRPTQVAVAAIPDSLDLAAAATIPTAFLTAYYAFDYLARLEAGETVLIHGAAGGVGMAAIQIAKLKGAKVIGTAGSPRKRRMLEMLGVDHVLNSRSLEFADEVMKITGGVGVDVVLNSLAGEAITKSLQCLRPFGRFLEIGKRDLYANSHIGLRPFRNNLSYFGIDADTLIVERAGSGPKDLQEGHRPFCGGRIASAAVPGHAHLARGGGFPLHAAIAPCRQTCGLDAGRTIHASLPVVRSPSAVKADATYLVTGGLGWLRLGDGRMAGGTRRYLSRAGRPARRDDGRSRSPVSRNWKRWAPRCALLPPISPIADSLDKVLATMRAEMPPLTGIIHSAAVIEDAPILNLTGDQLERVFQPKMIGAWNLHEATLARSDRYVRAVLLVQRGSGQSRPRRVRRRQFVSGCSGACIAARSVCPRSPSAGAQSKMRAS